MTVREAVTKYGLMKYQPSIGMSITNIVDTLYDDRYDVAYQTLTTINNRQDWECISSTEEISYLPPSIIQEVYEITS